MARRKNLEDALEEIGFLWQYTEVPLSLIAAGYEMPQSIIERFIALQGWKRQVLELGKGASKTGDAGQDAEVERISGPIYLLGLTVAKVGGCLFIGTGLRKPKTALDFEAVRAASQQVAT